MLRKFLKTIIYTMISIFLLTGIYLLSEQILSRKTVHEKASNQPKNITIYVMSNGVHTDLVLPIQNQYIDWTVLFPLENNKSQSQNFKFVAIGWGDKGFYLNTPEWKDLKASTAFVAATGIGETALHVTYYRNISENELTKRIEINENQYCELIQYIENTIEWSADTTTQCIETTAQYGNNDAFYEAHGAYSIFFTCNSWTNDALKSAGIKASKWVAFDKGILYQQTNPKTK